MYRALPLLLILGGAIAAPQSTITNAAIDGELNSEPEILDPSTIPGVLPLAADDDEEEEVVSTTVAEDITETTEATTTEATTTKRPKRYRSRAKSPSYFSKLSYFQKPNTPSSINQIDVSSGKRRFVSKCRCEKIWNCPKLQITVPRCPNEYFLCCF